MSVFVGVLVLVGVLVGVCVLVAVLVGVLVGVGVLVEVVVGDGGGGFNSFGANIKFELSSSVEIYSMK